ncbi:hypothetical protein WUBG_02022, partial [Wuchereria bancrofti]
VFDLLKFFVIVVIVVAIVLATIVRQEMIIEMMMIMIKEAKKSALHQMMKALKSLAHPVRHDHQVVVSVIHHMNVQQALVVSKVGIVKNLTVPNLAHLHIRHLLMNVLPQLSHQLHLHSFKREAIEKGETPPLPPLPPPPNAKSDDVEPKKSSLSDSQSPAERKSRKSKKGKRKRRRRSPSSSTPNSVNEHTSDELSEGELRKKILKKRKEVLKDMEEGLKPIVKPTLGKWEEQEAETTLLQNTTLKFGLESMEDVPKRVLRDTAHQFQSSKNVISQANTSMLDGIGMHATIPQVGIENSFSCKKGAKELGKQLDLPKSEAPSSGALFSSDIDTFLGKREQTGPINDLKNTQTSVFGAARGQQLISFFDDASDTLQPSQGTLRLSSLTRQLNAETERERKLARLPPEAFKADRETFGFVTKMLIEKDPGLEDRLWLALAEAIKDMEEAFTRKMDQYLDQLIMFISM